MKKLAYGLIAGIMIVSLAGFTALVPAKAEAGGLAPKVMVANPMVKMDKKATITIVGTGFQPDQEVSLLFTDVDGVQSDIGYALKPQPKANTIGAWVTTWSCGRYISKKLIKEGAYAITVTDGDYNILAHT
ncbi:MAG: hypothetical protein JSW12_14755, partial [Deltaproteobacteria bacterium]